MKSTLVDVEFYNEYFYNNKILKNYGKGKSTEPKFSKREV